MMISSRQLILLCIALVWIRSSIGAFCNVGGVKGDCVTAAKCSGGTHTTGFCPGNASIKCCTWGKCVASGVQGNCLQETTCPGSTTAGKCPGPAAIKCCTEGPGTSTGDVPQPGIELIKQFEGLRLEAYPDPLSGNLPITIGYGSTRKLDGTTPWKLGDKITEAEAEDLLVVQCRDDFIPSLAQIPVWSKLNVNQKGAILSFAYNLGARFYGNRNFTQITAVLRDEKWSDIRRVLLLYINRGSPVEAGLRRRRNAEADLFLRPV